MELFLRLTDSLIYEQNDSLSQKQTESAGPVCGISKVFIALE